MWTRVLVMVVLVSGCSKRADKPPAAEVVAPAEPRVDVAALQKKLDGLIDSGDNVGALEVSAQLVTAWRSKPGSLELADALMRHGMIQRYTGDWKGAKATLEEAAAIPVLKTHDEALHSVQYELGAIYMELRELDKSIAALQSAIDLATKLRGPDSVDVLDAKESLASTYDYGERYAEAEALFREVLAAHEKKNEPAVIGRVLTNLAINLTFQQRDPEAAEVFQRAVGVLTPLPESSMLAEVHAGLGGIYKRAKQPKRALASLQKALDLRLASLGPEHPIVAMDYHNLALALDDSHQLAKARDACAKSLAIRQAKLPPEHPYRVGTESLCAELDARKK